jgi:ZIP family zinc transporter
MGTVYVAVIGLSLLSVVTTTAGVALAVRFRESRVGIAVGIGFSAGIMVLISAIELIPEAAGQAGLLPALSVVAAGALLLFAMHVVIPHVHLFEETSGMGSRAITAAYLVVFGLILHDVPEGFAMANSYIASPSLGVLVALAIAIHNLPEEFAMAVPAVILKRRRFLYGSALLSALAEPAGAIIGLVAVDFLPRLNAFFVAFAAGAMIFVSFHELVPMARRYGNLPMFAAGIVLSLAVYLGLSQLIGTTI